MLDAKLPPPASPACPACPERSRGKRRPGKSCRAAGHPSPHPPQPEPARLGINTQVIADNPPPSTSLAASARSPAWISIFTAHRLPAPSRIFPLTSHYLFAMLRTPCFAPRNSASPPLRHRSLAPLSTINYGLLTSLLFASILALRTLSSPTTWIVVILHDLIPFAFISLS